MLWFRGIVSPCRSVPLSSSFGPADDFETSPSVIVRSPSDEIAGAATAIRATQTADARSVLAQTEDVPSSTKGATAARLHHYADLVFSATTKALALRVCARYVDHRGLHA